MKAYLAGPMRGIPQFNFPAFHEAAKELRQQGWEIISPAEMDEESGFEATTEDVSLDFLRKAILRDLKAISTCDAIILLPGWRRSSGANLELSLARYLSKEIFEFIDNAARSYPGSILDEAKVLVHGDRGQDYGHPIHDFSRTAQMWTAILGVEVQPWQVPLAMIAVKMSRLCNDYTKRDSVVDVAGYAETLQMVAERLNSPL